MQTFLILRRILFICLSFLRRKSMYHGILFYTFIAHMWSGTVSYTFLKFSKSVCYKSSLYDNNHLRLPNVFRTSVTYISQLTMDHRTATQSALDHRKAASKLKLSVDLFSSAQHHLNFLEQCDFDFRLRNQDILRQALYRSACLSFTFSECRFR